MKCRSKKYSENKKRLQVIGEQFELLMLMQDSESTGVKQVNDEALEEIRKFQDKLCDLVGRQKQEKNQFDLSVKKITEKIN